MCGRLNVTDDPTLISICIALGIDVGCASAYDQPALDGMLHKGRFIRATNTISIVIEQAGQRRLQHAIWWLLLEQTPTGFKPGPYTSFNSRYDKIKVKGSAGYLPYRQQRCIIPATGFGETEVIDGKRHYTDFIADEAIAFGGLYRSWLDTQTGELIYNCSIITLPPHPKLMPYHSKAMPLMLPAERFDAWLSSSADVKQFDDLLLPTLRVGLTAIPIDKPATYHQIGELQRILSDV